MARTVPDARAAHLDADAEGIRFHYDLPAAFFRRCRDPALSYSCHGFLTPDDTLAEAAVNKLELVARKIESRAEDHVLDVGCGWDSFVLWAAGGDRCRAVGITLSPSQAAYVREQATARGLAGRRRWTDAFVLGRVALEGDLLMVLRLRRIVADLGA